MRAALALGMSRLQAIRTIILPQALIRMLPPLGSLFVIAVKDSAIASVIAVPELLRQSQILAGKTYRPFELYTAAMIVYFLLCYPVARGVDRALSPARASGRVMTFDWRSSGTTCRCCCRRRCDDHLAHRASPWRWRSPAGSLLALPAAVAAWRRCGAPATAFVEFFRATPLILQIYWAFYVLPAYFDMQLSELSDRDRRPHLQHLRLQLRDFPRRHPSRSARASGTPAWRSA